MSSLLPIEGRVWAVGALCKAIADALEARFNPVAVQGELTGFSRAASGHCYFSLRDAQGQVRCAMFRRAASLLDFDPRDGELVELRGRLGVYEARGELQLVVESMRRAGQGALFEEFLRRKARLEQEGLFDASRKRPLPTLPRAIGLVTSLGAAALHDVVTALRRRVPHIPVLLAPASVQGAQAPAELVQALTKLYALASQAPNGMPPLDVILLVRGGGALEDLWAFNDEALVRCIAASPVPVLTGVGHETDFTLADFVADVRAPTPTAAAELVSAPRDVWLGALGLMQERLTDATQRHLDRQQQRLDTALARVGRPSSRIARQQSALAQQRQRLAHAVLLKSERSRQTLLRLKTDLAQKTALRQSSGQERLARAELRLGLLDPRLVLQRGYAWLRDADGHTLVRATDTRPGQAVHATLAEGEVDLTVSSPRPR